MDNPTPGKSYVVTDRIHGHEFNIGAIITLDGEFQESEMFDDESGRDEPAWYFVESGNPRAWWLTMREFVPAPDVDLTNIHEIEEYLNDPAV